MGSHVYNKVSEELVEKFKKIVPGKVYTKDEINQDFFMMKCLSMVKENQKLL